MELHGKDVSANKMSDVISIVSENLIDYIPENLPSRTTISNILDEGHLLAKHQVSEILTNSTNFDIFSDGTCRDGKKVMDIGVHTTNSTLVLGFKPVAKEDSNTVAKVIQDSLNESASLENISVNKLLLQLTSMMSDRSSVMKKQMKSLMNGDSLCCCKIWMNLIFPL